MSRECNLLLFTPDLVVLYCVISIEWDPKSSAVAAGPSSRLLLLLLSNKLFKKLSQKLLAVRKHETNKKRCHEQQITECCQISQ